MKPCGGSFHGTMHHCVALPYQADEHLPEKARRIISVGGKTMLSNKWCVLMTDVGEVNDEESNEKYDIADVRWLMVSLLSLCLLLFSYNTD